ncbi:hypothetical protein [Paraburkholderia phenoliruptrix]|uniref:hypothetical protein n=1 Tax=Paraburkholderia phenoliruptrix TaxID=252970 RepID=UPI0034CFBF10
MSKDWNGLPDRCAPTRQPNSVSAAGVLSKEAMVDAYTKAVGFSPASMPYWVHAFADNILAAASAQATPAVPKLSVWYGSMPESNGKTNWTAILHKGDLVEGHTIDRSEYPDRVRYAADCVRYLIGELPERPWILDYDADKRSGCAAPSPAACEAGDEVAAKAVNLEGLRDKLLAPRAIARDENGWLWHPDYPVCDEGTRADRLLEAFGIETAFVGMESDSPDFAERWHEEGLTDCSEWTPTPPAGDGWLLLEIYDTEDGPYAMFGRDQYEAENARKRENTRRLRAALTEGQA